MNKLACLIWKFSGSQPVLREPFPGGMSKYEKFYFKSCFPDFLDAMSYAKLKKVLRYAKEQEQEPLLSSIYLTRTTALI